MDGLKDKSFLIITIVSESSSSFLIETVTFVDKRIKQSVFWIIIYFARFLLL